MKKSILMVLVLSMFGLTACLDYKTPRNVIGTSYKALMENDSKTFISTLKGEALEEFGNYKAMGTLQDAFGNLNAALSGPFVIGVTDIKNRKSTKTYAAIIFGYTDMYSGIHLIYDLKVECELTYERQINKSSSDPVALFNENPKPKLSNALCQISSIKERK